MLREGVGPPAQAHPDGRNGGRKLRPPFLELLLAQLEQEVFGEAIPIAADLLIESLGRNAVQFCQVSVQQDFMPTQIQDQRLDFLHQDDLLRTQHQITRSDFEQNLYEKGIDPVFLGDLKPLLSASIEYDATVAISRIRQALIEKLPGNPWRGPG